MLSEFAKEKVFWTKKMNLRLVKFIERRPSIWNPKHPRYTSTEFRDQTYSEFASKYGEEFTGQAVKDRWTNIRSTFRNYLKKYTASWARGESVEYKVSWYLWEPCQFLMNSDKTVKDPKSTTECYYKNDDSQDLSSADNKISETDEPSGSSTNCNEIASNLFKILQGVQNNSFSTDNTRNGQIGRLVGRKLSQMSPLDAAMTSLKIMEILCLYDEINPKNPNNWKRE